MPIILGIESTAHTFGVGVVKDGKILANVKKTYTTESGGIIPVEAAKHHFENKHEIYFEALSQAKIDEKDIDAVAFSQGPGLAPCLLEGMKFAKEICEKLHKPMVPVNHCIAHLEIGALTGAKNPVMLYVSGANTQIIAYEAGKYRIFGETLDIGVGNFIDNFARFAGLGFPGGPAIEKLASQSKNYIEIPYKVKGMDIALSGILTNLKQKIERINLDNSLLPSHRPPTPNKLINDLKKSSSKLIKSNDTESINKKSQNINYNLSDLAYSMQETVFAMLVETAERALAHTGKKELLLGGGVACNSRLQEMCRIMCRERGAEFFCPEKSLLVDNGAMIAFFGEIIYSKANIPAHPPQSNFSDNQTPQPSHKANIVNNNLQNVKNINNKKQSVKIDKIKSKLIYYPDELNSVDIKPRQRTDEVEVRWKR